jgi:hypothetical protein
MLSLRGDAKGGKEKLLEVSKRLFSVSFVSAVDIRRPFCPGKLSSQVNPIQNGLFHQNESFSERINEKVISFRPHLSFLCYFYGNENANFTELAKSRLKTIQ